MSSPTGPAGPTRDGRVAVVTGSARGIGRSIAHRLAADGASVVVVDRDIEGAESVVDEIVGAGGSATSIPCDLGDGDHRARLVPRITDAVGRLDILVHNAATIGPRTSLVQLDDATLRHIVEVNLVAPLALSRDAVPLLEEAGGCIVTVGSIQARLPVATYVPYVATKGAIAAMTRALAVELAPSGVRVNGVLPGVIESPGMRQARPGRQDERPPAATLDGRWGSGADVAAAVAFLTGPDAGHVMGEMLRVDGGRALSRRTDPMLPDKGT